MKLPDYITSLNLLSGLLAIGVCIGQHYTAAAYLILAGVVFDALDGYVARRLKIESDFGAELDSLADLVTFGVAPMVLIATNFNTGWLTLLAILIPLCGALRLARHNINRHETKGYLIGLPITASGVAIPFVVLTTHSAGLAAIVVALLALAFLSTRRVNKLLK